MPVKKIISFILPLMVAAMPAAARQGDSQATVTGAVLDTVSNRPIPFAVVSIAGTRISTLTNRQGRFRLMFDPADVQLQIRKIGYRMGSVTLKVTGDTTLADVFLDPIPFELEAVTVTAEGDGPGTRIIRQAIARKQDLLSRIHDYRYDAYVKFVIRDLNKDEDSTASIVMLTETQTTAYWEQPDRYQEIITARQQSSNLDAENNLVSVGQIVNFNKNRVDMQKYSVVSPTADDALDHYRYRLLDTLSLDGGTVFRLAIVPRSEAAPLFAGMIDIADSTFDVLAIDVGMNDAVRFDFFDNLRYRQQMRDMGDEHWMPEEIRFSGEVHFGIPIPGFPEHLSFEHIAALRDYRFDEGQPPRNLGEYLVVVEEEADDTDPEDWEAGRTLELTGTERAAYGRIDSLENDIPIGTKLLSGVATLALSNTADFFHFNRVEGAYVGAGATWRDVSPDWILRAKTGYDFGSDEWQHRFGAQYRLVEHRRFWVGGFYSDEIVQRPAMVSGAGNSTSLALFAKVDPLDYYSQRGFGLTLSTKLVDFTQLRLQYNDFDQTSVPVTTDFAIFASDDKLQRDNPSIVDGRLRSLSASLTYDSRPLLKRKGRDFRFNVLIYTQITLTAEYASPSFITNDFEFRRYAVRLHREQRTLNMGLTSIDAVAGTSTGRLPPQRYFTVDFGNGVFFQPAGFNTMDERNFSGNRAAMFYVSHDFDQLLLRKSRIPLLRDVPFTVSVHGGAFWTDFVNHTANPGDLIVRTAPSAYGEIGFGIGNLTPMIAPFNFSAWFTWQVSSYNTNRFVFAIGVPG